MTTILIIASILLVFLIGFIQIFRELSRLKSKIHFANEYRNKFIEFANKYFKSYDKYNRTGKIDGSLYVWLTRNVNKIQSHVGYIGIMSYKPAYQNYMINDYQIIINTIPMFRQGQVEHFDVNSVDDCLLRYSGHLEDCHDSTSNNLKNPIIWFREGFKEIFSIPIFILNWFGIISKQKLESIKDSLIYKLISGLIALITLASGIVTIIIGYEQTIQLLIKLVKE